MKRKIRFGILINYLWLRQGPFTSNNISLIDAYKQLAKRA